MSSTKRCYCQTDASEFERRTYNYEELFETEGISDITLYGNDQSQGIRSSKILLACLGPVFDDLLNESELRLDFPLTIVKTINEFALTGKLNCDEMNVAQILRAANDFEIYGILSLGGRFLISAINIENALNFYKIFHEFLCRHFVKWCTKYILLNFQALGQTSTFLQTCRASWLEEWLPDDELNASEEQIFTILLEWAKVSPENLEAFPRLVEHIRFALMPSDYFNQVVKTTDLLRENSLFQKVTKSHQLQTNKAYKPKYRLPYELVFAVGGFSYEPTNAIEIFDIRAKKWSSLNHQEFPSHAYHGIVSDDFNLHVIGGFGDEGLETGPNFFSSVYSFSLKNREWRKYAASLLNPRCYISTAVVNDEVYCMGGYDGTARLRSVEKYQATINSWTFVAPMREIRSDASAVGYNNKVIIVGGYTGSEILDSIEIYDPEKNEWAFGPRMNTPRSGLKVAILNDKLFAIGGFNGFERLRSVETLDLLHPNAAWTTSSSLNTRRSNFGVTVVDEAILVAGGFDGGTVTSECEIFDSKTSTWSPLPPMSMERSALSLVTVKDLPNLKMFLPYHQHA